MSNRPHLSSSDLAPSELCNNKWKPALFRAADSLNAKTIRLLTYNPDVEIKTPEGATALLQGAKCEYRNGESMLLLLNEGADRSVRDGWGTVSHYTVR